MALGLRRPGGPGSASPGYIRGYIEVFGTEFAREKKIYFWVDFLFISDRIVLDMIMKGLQMTYSEIDGEWLDRFSMLLADIYSWHPGISIKDVENHPYWLELQDVSGMEVDVDDVKVYEYYTYK